MFSGCSVLPDSKQTKLGSSDQEASADKSTGTVLVPCPAWKCVPTAISSGVDISKVPGCYLLQQKSSHRTHRGSQKITSRIGVINSQPIFLFLTYF